MGLKGLLNRISGGDKGGNTFCFVLGLDKRFFRRNLLSQGSHLQDDEHRLACFSSSEGVGTFRKTGDTGTKALGPVSIACELTTELWSFPNLDWIPDRLAPKGGNTNGHHELFEDDEVLDNAWSEGFAVAHQKQSDEETKKKLAQILLLAVLGAFMMFLLVGASTGLLGNLFSGFGKVFGGG